MSCNPETGRVAPADSMQNISGLYPEECKHTKSQDTAQNPQTVRPLVEDLSYRNTHIKHTPSPHKSRTKYAILLKPC